jgi:hypothetical protein
MAFDMKLVPLVQNAPRNVTLTIHTGIVWSLRHGIGVGIRAACDVNSSQFGFAPLVNKSWSLKNERGFFKPCFVEADLPVRFNRPPRDPSANAVTFATHFGLAF